MEILLMALAGGGVGVIWLFAFRGLAKRKGYIILPCQVCGRSVLVPEEKPEAVTKAEKIFKGKAIPFAICEDCQA